MDGHEASEPPPGDYGRRAFLEQTGKFILLTGAASLGWEAVLAGTPEAAPNYVATDHWWGMTIDIDKCIGCGNCVGACAAENNVPEGFFRTWIERYQVSPEDLEHPKVDSPGGGKNGFPPVKSATDKMFFVPKLCNHCTSSPCIQVCPVGATFDSPDGVVLMDDQYCLGCRYCIQACPYGARWFHPTKRVAAKCTLCYHRLVKGLVPACVEACPTGARIFGEVEQRATPLARFMRFNDVQVLKPHLNTKPKVYYASLDGEVR